MLAPSGAYVVATLKRFLPTEYLDKLRHKLVLAGRGPPDQIDQFLVIRVLSVVAVPVLWLVVWTLTNLTGTTLRAVIVLIGLFGAIGPDAWLNRTVAERQFAMRRKLPDVLDLLTISVEAGSGLRAGPGPHRHHGAGAAVRRVLPHAR